MSATTCINLFTAYGERYRITWDEAAGAGRSDPWLMQIPCCFGTIYPQGGDLLALELDRHPKVAKEVAAIPGVRLWQDGDKDKTFLFPASQFEAVAALVQPKCRRRLTEEQRQANLDRLAKYWFQPAGQS